MLIRFRISLWPRIRKEHWVRFSELARKTFIHNYYLFCVWVSFNLINTEFIQIIIKLHPVIYINEAEALPFTYSTAIETAAKNITKQILNTVIITFDEKGSLTIVPKTIPEVPSIKYEIINTRVVPVYKENIVDTIGAGDSHIVAFIAYTSKGLPIKGSLFKANEDSASAVQTKGAHLADSILL